MDKTFMYNEKKMNPTATWLLFLFLGWSYGQFGKIGIQLLYYITFGGFGIWILIRLFTLSDDIKIYNGKVAKECGFTDDEIVSLGLTIPEKDEYNESSTDDVTPKSFEILPGHTKTNMKQNQWWR